jgi:hypothetical protein
MMENETDYRAMLVDGVKVLESKRVDLTTTAGHEVPVDPADETQCESCQ